MKAVKDNYSYITAGKAKEREEKMKNKDAALVVLSGGQDSTTCLLWALKKYKTVEAVSFDYNQRHKKELECAAAICKKFGVRQKIMDMSLLSELAPNSLTREEINVDENAPEHGTPNSFVEGRNLLFLTYAAIYAKGLGINDIITGVSQSDFSGYPDCRNVFISLLIQHLILQWIMSLSSSLRLCGSIRRKPGSSLTALEDLR